MAIYPSCRNKLKLADCIVAHEEAEMNNTMNKHMIDIRIFFIMTFWILEYLSYVIQEATVSSFRAQ